MHDDEVDVDAGLVRRLLRSQLPALADLPLAEVGPWGTDHAVWRLGRDLAVRLPRIAWAGGHPEREAAAVTALAPHLPVEVPEPVALGAPGEGYPFRWAVVRWLEGRHAEAARLDATRLARDLGGLVRALGVAPTNGAPPARSRARHLADYDDDARAAIGAAAHLIDAGAATEVWHDALDAPPHRGPRRWVHGDLAGNCLVRGDRLSGIIDWGGACAGDPATDVAVIWTPPFDEPARAAFLAAAGVDDQVVRRSRGAALHQACAALPYYVGTHPPIVERARHQLRALGVGAR